MNILVVTAIASRLSRSRKTSTIIPISKFKFMYVLIYVPDIPSLEGKVIVATGGLVILPCLDADNRELTIQGTAGWGKVSIKALSLHIYAYLYFTERNIKTAEELVVDVKEINAHAALTFLEMDFLSLSSVKKACTRSRFQHDPLDIPMCNAGVMFKPPGLSEDIFEVTLATNYIARSMIARSMIIQQFILMILRTAQIPGADVRLVSLASTGWRGHSGGVISFATLRTTQEGFIGGTLASVLYAAELSRRHPEIMAVSVPSGVVKTDLVNNLSSGPKAMVYASTWLQGMSLSEEEQGCLNQPWVAARARRDQPVNGTFYMPVGILSKDRLDCTRRSEKLAGELWKLTDEVLTSF
ncbi:putative short-chain dehydrogenase [Camillea tinctor]|nr:putative short-chain dehydrogenase [Camillea tinctor]